MKAYFYFILLTLVALSSLASEGWIPSPPSHTVVHLEDSFGHCTGTRISNDGHILTARHCFNACIIQKKIAQEEKLFPEAGYLSPILYKINQYKGHYCEMKVDGKKQRLELIAGSHAFMTPSEQSSLYNQDKDLFLKFLEKSYFYNGDFIIVRQKKPQSKHCDSTDSFVGLEYETPVYYDGYPGISSGRQKGRNSDGISLLRSEGVSILSSMENSCLVQRKTNLDLMIKKYDRSELILSTVDIVPGASGSSLKNKGGKIIGLLNSLNKQSFLPFAHYCSGSAIAVSIKHIKELSKKYLDPAEIEKAFDCQ